MATKKSVQNAKRRAKRAMKSTTAPQLPTPVAYHNIFSTPDGKVFKFEPLSGAAWLFSMGGWKLIPTLSEKEV